MRPRLTHVTAALVTALVAALPATAAQAAQSPLHIVRASEVSGKRIVQKNGNAYYSFSAVVRFDRALTSSERSRYGLISGTWATRTNYAAGTKLPDALFGGTTLGRVGRKSAHCYFAEIAQLHSRRTFKPAQSWVVALHDGHSVLRTAPRVTVNKYQTATEDRQIRDAGC
jgi:hypothetical protein